MGKGTVSTVEKKELSSFLYQVQEDLAYVFTEMENSLRMKIRQDILQEEWQKQSEFLETLHNEEVEKMYATCKNESMKIKKELTTVSEQLNQLLLVLKRKREELMLVNMDSLGGLYIEIGQVRNQLEQEMILGNVTEKERFIRNLAHRLDESIKTFDKEDKILKEMDGDEAIQQQKYVDMLRDSQRNLEELLLRQKMELNQLLAHQEKVEEKKTQIAGLQNELNREKANYEQRLLELTEIETYIRQLREKKETLLVKDATYRFQVEQLEKEVQNQIQIKTQYVRVQKDIQEEPDMKADIYLRKREDVLRRIQQKEKQLSY